MGRTTDLEDAMILYRIADLLAQMSAKNRKNLCDYIEASKINRSDYARLSEWMRKAQEIASEGGQWYRGGLSPLTENKEEKEWQQQYTQYTDGIIITSYKCMTMA